LFYIYALPFQDRRKPKVSQLRNGTLDSLKISTISLASSSLVAERGQEIRFPGKEMQSVGVYMQSNFVWNTRPALSKSQN